MENIDARLEKTRRLINTWAWWRLSIILSEAALVFYVLVLFMPRERILPSEPWLYWPVTITFTILCVAGIGIYFLDRLIVNKILSPFRFANTSKLIPLVEIYKKEARGRVIEELLHRANGGDRMAKSYFFDKPYAHYPDKDGLQTIRPTLFLWVHTPNSRPLKVITMDGEFTTVKPRSMVSPWTNVALAAGLTISSGALRDVKWNFKPVLHPTFLSFIGSAAIFLGLIPALIIGCHFEFRSAHIPEKLAPTQLIFLYVHGPYSLQKTVASRLATLGRSDLSVAAICYRLGLYTEPTAEG